MYKKRWWGRLTVETKMLWYATAAAAAAAAAAADDDDDDDDDDDGVGGQLLEITCETAQET